MSRHVAKVKNGLHVDTWERIEDGDIPHPSDVIEAVAIVTQVPAIEFMQRRSNYRFTKCRYMAAAILNVDFDVPINDTARIIRRSKSTAAYGIVSIMGNARHDTELSKEIERVRDMLSRFRRVTK